MVKRKKKNNMKILLFNFTVGSAVEYIGNTFRKWLNEIPNIDIVEIKEQNASVVNIDFIINAKPDIIILNDLLEEKTLDCVYYYKKCFPNTKVIVIYHSWRTIYNFDEKNADDFKRRYFNNLVDDIICLNYIPENTNNTSDLFKRVHNFYHPIDTMEYYSKIPWNKRDNLFGYFGNILPHKMSLEFIEKIQQTDIIVDCYGKILDWEEYKEYNNLVNNCKNIVFKGYINQEDMPDYINRYKYFVMAHDGYEPFNVTLLQCILCGTIPLVVNDRTSKKFDSTWIDWADNLYFGSNTVEEMINNLEHIKTLDCNDISIQISNQAKLKFDYSKFKDFFIKTIEKYRYKTGGE